MYINNKKVICIVLLMNFPGALTYTWKHGHCMTEKVRRLFCYFDFMLVPVHCGPRTLLLFSV